MRKTIAVCVTGYNWQKESRIIAGIVECCQKEDINVLCFASLETKPGLASNRVLSSTIIKCESEIFHLINYKKIQGLICLSEEILDWKEVELMHSKCLENNIPFININSQNQSFEHNIVFKDTTAFESVVRHIVEFHGAKKVDFISGFKGNIQSEERLAVYKKVLQENNIPVEDWRIGYGEFWRKSVECAKEFIAREIPDAIICANDSMAIMVTEYLENMGIGVPEQVMVSGFDGTDDAQQCDTTVTTIVLDFIQAGYKAVNLIQNLWNGKEVPAVSTVGSLLITGESCGCVKNRNRVMHNYVGAIYQASYNFKHFNKDIMAMNNAFINAGESIDLFHGALKSMSQIMVNRIYICVNPDVENSRDFFYGKNSGYDYIHIPDRILYAAGKGSSCPEGLLFDKKNLVPEDILNEEKPVFFAFTPFYLRDKTLGYIAYEPESIKGESDFLKIWIATLANNFGSFCMRKGLEDMSMHDPLTGLLNRRGMLNLINRGLENNQNPDSYVSVICIDMDNLKKINDAYGHDAGDNAIVTISQAIKNSCRKDIVCTRTGGDEFCLVMLNSDEKEAESIINNIDLYLEKEAERNPHEYKVTCSCGLASVKMGDFDIDQVLKLADFEMYKNKITKKQKASEE